MMDLMPVTVISLQAYLYNNLGTGAYLTNEKAPHASMGSYKNDNTLIGFFGRVSYGYDNRYNLMVSVRREGSSKFGNNNKWEHFLLYPRDGRSAMKVS